MKLVSNLDRTNSMRKEQVFKRFQLFSDNQMEKFVKIFEEDATVTLVGESEFDNQQDILEFFQTIYALKIEKIVLHTLIVENEHTSVMGEVHFKATVFDFCAISRCRTATTENLITDLKVFSVEQKV